MGNSNNLIMKRTKDITDLKEVYASYMRIKKNPKEFDVALEVPKKNRITR